MRRNTSQSWYSIDICAIPVWVSQSWISAVITTNEHLFAEISLHLRLNHLRTTQDSKYLTISLRSTEH
ncbi:hypothetical protein VN97_g5044 [Penicillium thymicola]|uniref:Uncharacterized protein n=1 Tax=Penicillium thymicola TaxID=293382 RepID=A0AAI9TJF9_PENTH|nr:hypothetical protein VN97_g5044 [Penicillium thymicola]